MKTIDKPHFAAVAFIAVFIIAVVISYQNTFDAPFIFDDFNSIVKNNPELQITTLDLDQLANVVTQTKGNKRPIAHISLAINHFFSGTDTFWYHVINTAIHLLTGFFLFLWLRLTLAMPASHTPPDESTETVSPSYLSASWIAFAAALLWLLHPLQTNAVTYIVQRMTSMAAMFYLLSMLLYVKGRLSMRGNRPAAAGFLLGGCVLSGLCAIASKEIAATLPIFILLYEWFFFQGLRPISPKRLFSGALIAVLLFSAIAFLFLGSNPVNRILAEYQQWDFTMPQRVLTEFRVIALYLSLVFFPHSARLMLDYDYPLSFAVTHPPTTLLSVLMVAVLFLVALYSAKNHRLLSFGLLWFLGNLVIESSVIGIEIIYEHRLYLPSMMILLLVVFYPARILRRQWLITPAFIAIALVLGFWTHQRNQVWANDIVFWKDGVVKAPGDVRPIQNLAYSHQINGNYKEAIKYYRTSIELSPDPAAIYNMGLCLSEIDHHLEAVIAFKKAADLNYEPSMLYAKLAYEQTMMGEFKAALDNYQRALEIDPDNEYARHDYQQMRRFLQQCRSTEACVDALCQQIPQNPALRFKKGLILEGRRKIGEAISNYEQVMEMMPESDREIYILTLNHLATCYILTGKIDRSMDLLLKGAQIAPNDPAFAYQLAALHAYQDNHQKSLEWLEKAINRGFADLHRLETDTRFRALYENSRFRELMGRIKESK